MTELTRTELTIDNGGTAITRSTRELTPQVWTMIERIAPAMYRSRMFGVTSTEAAAAVMLKGYELGLGITASFEFIQVIQGKPGLSPRGALALLHGHPEIKELKVTRLEDKGNFVGFECYMKRANGFSYTTRFTLEDAQKAGLVKPDSGWAKYPENMCMWRAIGFCADVVAPDICAGMTTLMKAPEDFGVALSEAGEVIESQWTQPTGREPAVTPDPPPSPTEQPVTLEALANKYGGEAILAANLGRIPSTQEELNAVATKLGGVA